MRELLNFVLCSMALRAEAVRGKEDAEGGSGGLLRLSSSSSWFLRLHPATWEFLALLTTCSVQR